MTLLVTRRGKSGLAVIRNIGIIAHIDAGKTTTTERMLYYAGATKRVGEVDRGDTVMDYLPEERARGITITAAAIRFPWKTHCINLIDTPGHVDFGIEVERSLRVVDGAVAILDASAGVQAQTRVVWKQARKYGIPRMVYVNKMDTVGASFEHCMDELQTKCDDLLPLAIHCPKMSPGGTKFEGLYDLIRCRLLRWTGPNGSCIEESDASDIPAVQKSRERLLELIANNDDSFLETYLGPTPPSEDCIKQAIRRLTLQAKACPVLCGSSYTNVGVQPILDAVVDYLPSPAEGLSPPLVRLHPDALPTAVNLIVDKVQFLALAFKVIHDEQQRGLLVFVRVYAGRLSPRMTLRNASRGIKERVTRILSINANRFDEELDSVGEGQVAILAGLKSTRTGDTLSLDEDVVFRDAVLSGINAPPPVFFRSVEAASPAAEAQVDEALRIVCLEDPSLAVKIDPDNRQRQLAGMGELHLEVVGKRINRDLRAQAILGPIQISYREVVEDAPFYEDAVINREISGSLLAAQLHLTMTPTMSDLSDAVITIDPHGVTREVIEAIREGVTMGLMNGPLAGYPVIGVRVHVDQATMIDGSSPDAFRYLAFTTVSSLLRKCQHKRLAEPVMLVEITLPQDQQVGPLLTDIHAGRRGHVMEVTHNHSTAEHLILAEIPLAGLLDYSSHLRSLTSGAATFSVRPHLYRPMSAAESGKKLESLGHFNVAIL